VRIRECIQKKRWKLAVLDEVVGITELRSCQVRWFDSRRTSRQVEVDEDLSDDDRVREKGNNDKWR